MTIAKILEELKLIENTFRTKIITTNYKKISENEISWSNYTSGIFKNIYANEYESIIRGRQYSYLLAEDRGCMQFYFIFDKGIIMKVKMAYYPYPVELRHLKDEYENMMEDSNVSIRCGPCLIVNK